MENNKADEISNRNAMSEHNTAGLEMGVIAEPLTNLTIATPEPAVIITKKARGQFYTTKVDYILAGMPMPPDSVLHIIEPFAGQGDIIDWIKKGSTKPILAYDIDPKRAGINIRDTLTSPPDYANSWIITNPPYLARNKSTNKTLYDLYDTNDLYKAFILSFAKQNNCAGGIIIIPAGFFFSPRDIDVRCRHLFMSRFKITKVKYFEETVFDDTPTTVVAIAFEKSDTELNTQNVLWEKYPGGTQHIFTMSEAHSWIIGGEIYNLPIPPDIKISRFVEGYQLKPEEQQTFITLCAMDSGKQNGPRIGLEYLHNYIYQAKDCSRTYATFIIAGKKLSEQEQMQLCDKFNQFIEKYRTDTWSLFLPQYRESKEYARKRIPFELAYRITLHLLQ